MVTEVVCENGGKRLPNIKLVGNISELVEQFWCMWREEDWPLCSVVVS